MKFAGVLGFDGLVSSSLDHTAVATSSSLESEPSRQKDLLLKHGRPSAEPLDDWMSLKVARTEAMPATAAPKSAPFLFSSSSHPIFPGGEKMLSFSSEPPLSARPDSSMIRNDGSLPYYLHHYHHPSLYSDSPSAASFYRNGGMISGSTNVNMHGVMTGVRGPFTPSQWIELEYQALIYKHINANVPIPASLLIPIRRGINTSGLSAYSPGPFRSTTLGWGSYHLGFYGNGDPEPGRCRRTDGKKWRCSRDAVADQKYCERHLNRGRHRSRKLVEGRSGQAMPVTASTQLDSAGSAGTTSNGLNAMQQQTGGLQSNVSDTNPSQFDRVRMQKDNIHDLSQLTDASPKPANRLFHESKHLNPFEGSSSSDFLLKPPRNSFSENISFDSSSQHEDQNSRTNPLRHFIDDWPKSQHDHPSMSWPELEQMKSGRTQLSISVHTDFFSSSSSSPNQEKLALSPLRLSREFNPVKNYIMGGPLGEVLNNTSTTTKNYNTSSLNLLIDGWDSSPRQQSSPSGVLHKTAFGSLSSSAGSSPRADNRKDLDNSSNLCEDLIGSTLGNPMAVPLL